MLEYIDMYSPILGFQYANNEEITEIDSIGHTYFCI